jgi:uncharacterized protein YggE
MRKLPLILGIMLSLSPAFGQVDSNSITVTASRSNTSGPPDQAVFSVRVESGLDISLDDVIAELQGTGIDAANLQNVYTSFIYINSPSGMTQQMEMLEWSFTFTAPFTKNKDTITLLTNLQAAIAKKNNGQTMSFSIQGTQSSAQPPACSLPDLLTNAQTQAQKLADGAGVSVGNILAMSSPTAGTGSFVPCTLTVKFGLLR